MTNPASPTSSASSASSGAQQDATTQKFRPVADLSYEEARKELIEVVDILELGQMSIDESLNYWERGEELAAYCENYLDSAAARIEKALTQREERAGASAGSGAEGDATEA